MGIEATRHLPGITYCVYIRGIASGGAFVDEYCRQYYLTRLSNLLTPYQVNLHAFTILENEVFLLMTPQSSTGLSGVINTANKCFEEYYRSRFERGSTPLSKTVLTSEVRGRKLTLDCQKFIERLAVDTGISDAVGLWQCSSYSSNGFGCRPKYLSLHRHCMGFLRDGDHPYPRYREFIASPVEPEYHAYLLGRIKSGAPVTKRRSTDAVVTVRKLKRWDSGASKTLY